MKKAKKIYKPKFDWSGFKLLGGVGLVFSAFGPFLFWAVYTAPTGTTTERYALTTTQRLARMVPEDISSKIVMVFAVLCTVFGLFMITVALFRAFRFMFFRR